MDSSLGFQAIALYGAISSDSCKTLDVICGDFSLVSETPEPSYHLVPEMMRALLWPYSLDDSPGCVWAEKPDFLRVGSPLLLYQFYSWPAQWQLISSLPMLLGWNFYEISLPGEYPLC